VETRKYISAAEFAIRNGIAERTARHYCATGKIEGAFLTGKTWNIPENAPVPLRRAKKKKPMPLLDILREQMEMRLPGGIYHKTQIELTYNSNHMEGSRLTQEQTRFIFETNTIGRENEILQVDDIIETSNHFRCVDSIIARAEEKLHASFICELHAMLKSGTSDSRKSWFSVGSYKKLPNEVGGLETTAPENVATELQKLLHQYHSKKHKSLDDILGFHHRFELIHPFQDGNGRVGRLIMFKECLANGIIPFIITDELKMFYYRGLRHWPDIPGYLRDTCLAAQDEYKLLMQRFRIAE